MNDLANDFPLLTLLIVIPVLAAFVVAVFPSSDGTAARITAIAGSGLTALFAAFMVIAFDRHSGDFQFAEKYEWLPSLGISWGVGVDGISLFLVAISALIFPIALLAYRPPTGSKSYHAWMLLLEAGCIGAFLATDLFLFFVFFEVVLVPMYFLISGWGFARRKYAALKFFLYTMAGSAFLLVGLLALVFLVANKSGAPVTFDLLTLQNEALLGNLSTAEARWIFAALAIGFAVKVPIFPFHTWQPVTYEQSPIAAVIVSAAVMVKLGTYGLIRFALTLTPDAAFDAAPIPLTLALIGMIYGAIVAAFQRDLKRLIAFSSISHLGFVVLGTFSFSEIGVTGAVVQMINHSISTGALFLLLGMIYVRWGSTDISNLSGLQKLTPVLAAMFTVVMLSSVGLPGLNGFVGEFLILLGTFTTHRWWAVVGTATVVLAAVYLLWAYQRVFHGEPSPEVVEKAAPDLHLREKLLLAPLIVLIVFLGVFPKPVIERIEPSVQQVLTPSTLPSQPPPSLPHQQTPSAEAGR